MKNSKLRLFVSIMLFCVFTMGFTYKYSSSQTLSFSWLGKEYHITLPDRYNIKQNSSPAELSFTRNKKVIGGIQNRTGLPLNSKVLLQKDITSNFGDGGLYALLYSGPAAKEHSQRYEIVALINDETPESASYFWLITSKDSWLKDMELLDNIIKSIKKENR